MLGIFGKKNESKRLREAVKGVAHMARKVVNYRKDILPESAVADLRSMEDRLRKLLRKDTSATDEQLSQAHDEADVLLRKHGGDLYPVHFWNENIEVVIVAAIVAIAIRTYFVQPFKIPTNSMWPTYAGMKAEVYDVTANEGRPGALERAYRLLTKFATNYRVKAPASGEVVIPVRFQTNGNSAPLFDTEAGRSFLIFPAVKWRYQLGVMADDGEVSLASLTVPGDFDLGEVIAETYFPDSPSRSQTLYYEALQQLRNDQAAERREIVVPTERGPQRISVIEVYLRTGYQVEQGELMLDFDILTGDMLFVDRFSYHFVSPDVGDPIVFRTDNIPGERLANGQGKQQYYIKRLVGVPGDTLEVQPPVLMRNGEPITGAEAFERNHAQEGEYEGYLAQGFLQRGRQQHLEDGYFFAMGDNSDQSADSRAWGFGEDRRTPEEIMEGIPLNHVPEKDVVGRAFFIFYPLTARWGVAE